ncbi:hypothetical protein CSUI_003133 [Cystoisospora suis]|uniref:Uncharacterized protein n=1 Tax=Cystoisospora suis TaxID=483139 RepID=A0A2C6KG49_9APIC|nr:hypothetical protein CSUI_003133 [Cystoisospora suis]
MRAKVTDPSMCVRVVRICMPIYSTERCAVSSVLEVPPTRGDCSRGGRGARCRETARCRIFVSVGGGFSQGRRDTHATYVLRTYQQPYNLLAYMSVRP